MGSLERWLQLPWCVHALVSLHVQHCSVWVSGQAGWAIKPAATLVLSTAQRRKFKTTFIVTCSGFLSWYKSGMELLAAVCCRGSSVRQPP